MKSRFQALWLLFCTGAVLLLAMGCNDTLRQFITPVPPPTGDPSALAHAITLSTNPAPTSSGTDMHIDVSGDSSVGTVPLGINPVFLGKSGNRIFVINSGDGGPTPPTVSVYTALLPQSATVTTVTLPSAPAPDAAVNPVAGGASSSGNIYIANKGSNNISVISGNVLAVTATIPLPAGDSGPVMIAGNTANNQIFVVNQASGTVTQISTIDNTVVSPSITVGSQPVWGVMSPDGLFVFVVNQGSNNVSVIDASLRTVIATIPVGASPNFAFYDPRLQRVYVSNTGSNTISVIRADNITAANLPVKLKDVAVSGAPTSVTALSDGTRAYAALGNCPAGVNHTNIIAQLGSCAGNLVSVIDAASLLETRTITVGTGAISIDSSSDASKVFVVNSHDTVTDASGPHTAGTISDIRTSTNLEVMRKLAPQQDPNCKVSSTVFCPVQTPFMVRTFP
jgi:YVTN family beta-propeller protein